MRMFFRILWDVVSTLIIIIAIFILGSFLPKVIPIDHWYSFRIVVSGSMTPTIPVGSAVMTWPSGNYQVGDIVTFFDPQSGADLPSTHRIVAIEKNGGETLYTTKGDANNTADYLKKTKDEILGKVYFHVPGVGYVADFVKIHVVGVMLALVILIVGWVSFDIFYAKRDSE